ncbi:MYXO-CTERM sorting domain-containing protein [Myxococcota bacterium]|nr:MYXO-CTERM sorting domain-containing protein [Myxococcota bacterium]
MDVVVLGEGFSDSAEARIGGITLVGNDVVSDTTISGRTPTTLPVGVHDVEVVVGDDSVVLVGAFEVTGGGCGCASGGRGAAWLGLLAAPLLAWRRRR